MENVYDFVDESRHQSWAELSVEFGNPQEHKIRGYWQCVQHYSKVGERTFWINYDCEVLGVFMSSDQMGTGKKYVYDDSWKTVQEQQKDGRVKWKDSGFFSSYQDAVGTDGNAIEFEWWSVPGFSTLSFLETSKMTWRRGESSQRSVRTGSSSCQWSNDIEWKTNDANCVSHAEKIKKYAMIFSQGHWTEKLSGIGKNSVANCTVVLRHGRTCSKMRWEILRTGKQECGATVQSFQSLLGWSPFQGRGTWINRRIVRCPLTNSLEMLVFGTNWQTRHLMDSTQICSIRYKMDSGIWPTSGKAEFLYSPHKQFPTKLSCG